MFVVGGADRNPTTLAAGELPKIATALLYLSSSSATLLFFKCASTIANHAAGVESKNSGSLRVGVRTTRVTLTGDGDDCRRERLPRADMLQNCSVRSRGFCKQINNKNERRGHQCSAGGKGGRRQRNKSRFNPENRAEQSLSVHG